MEYYALTGLGTGQLHMLSLLVMQEIGSLVKPGAKKPPAVGLLDSVIMVVNSKAITNPDALSAGGREIVAQPRQQKDVFLMPRRAGRFELRCADHDWEGMVGEIVVE